MQMTRERVEELTNFIKSLAGGTIFSVKFIKRTTGEERTMVCRLGTKNKTKGGKQSGDPIEGGFLTVWDVQKNAFRRIALDGIIEMKIRGEHYDAKGE